jgi:mRNA interferase MazF
MVKFFVPDRGDIIFLNFCPQSGRKQSGVRPTLVLSPKIYNQKTNLCVCCPITKQTKNYPFEILFKGNNVSGVILADHIKNLDWVVRKAKFVEKSPPEIYKKVLQKIITLTEEE